MKKDMKKVLAYSAMDEMQRRLKAYQSKPDANEAYISKSKGYLQAITDYILNLETEIVDLKFNQDIFVIVDNTNAHARLRTAQKRIAELETMLEAKGVDIHTQRHMLPDMPEMKRMNSINQAKQLWPELY